MSGTVRCERDGPVATVTLHQPARRNAMTLEMWRSIPALCAELDADPDVRVVVLRGAGNAAFAAGSDMSQFAEARPSGGSGTPGSYDAATIAAFSAIGAIEKPVVAAVRGFCIGGGLGLAAAADIRYASADAVFGLPPARLGLGYWQSGIATLVDLVGPAVVKEMIFAAEWVDASTALRWGLINQVVPTADFDEFVDARVATMASRAPLSQRAAKLAIDDYLRPAEERRPEIVAEAIAACAGSDDFAEGVAAFLEKRPPNFGGH